MVDPATQIVEWSGVGGSKWKGLMKNRKKQGIVREVHSNRIRLTQYKDDQQHGLKIAWYEDGTISVGLYKNDNYLGGIIWNTKNWTETYSRNKEVFDSVLSIDDFRP